jgi:hypothetical protein
MVGILCAAFGQKTDQNNSPNSEVLFTVTDRNGNPLGDIKPEEISVHESGAAVQVLGLESADKVPVRLGILLLGSTPSFKAQQEAAMQLLASLRPNLDQAFVLTQATSNKSRGWPTQQLSWDPYPKGVASLVRGLRPDASLPGTTNIATQMLALDREKPFRRILVEFRDPSMEGMIDWGPLPYEKLEQAQLNEIADYQRSNTFVYTFAVEDSFYGHAAGPPPGETMSRENASYLAYKDGESKIERVAMMTGGRSFTPRAGNFKSEAAQITKDLQGQYIVRFVSSPAAGNSGHPLEIRIARKDAKVFVQKQFYPAGM